MERSVDALKKAYEEFAGAMPGVFEARELSGDHKTEAMDAALAKFKLQWDLFRVACDEAEELVEFFKQQVCLGLQAKEATGPVAAKTGQDGSVAASLPPNNVIVLD